MRLNLQYVLFCLFCPCLTTNLLAGDDSAIQTLSFQEVFAGEQTDGGSINGVGDNRTSVSQDVVWSEQMQFQQAVSQSSVFPISDDCVACNPDWSAWDSLELFAGLDGSKQPQDFGVNAHFGARLHANWGFPLLKQWGIGGQIGTGVNMTDNAVRVTGPLTGSEDQQQSFTTVGLFQRKNGFTWGLVYDFLAENAYDQFYLTQFRGRAGYAFSSKNEIGFYGILPDRGDRGNWGAAPVKLRSLAQGSIYWRHTWLSSAETTVWLGVAESHGQRNIALGGNSPSGASILFGSDLQVPLNNYVAIYGQANFISPADTGTVDAYLGFAIYPHGNAVGWRKRKYSPVMPVANNTCFSVDLR